MWGNWIWAVFISPAIALRQQQNSAKAVLNLREQPLSQEQCDIFAASIFHEPSVTCHYKHFSVQIPESDEGEEEAFVSLRGDDDDDSSDAEQEAAAVELEDGLQPLHACLCTWELTDNTAQQPQPLRPVEQVFNYHYFSHITIFFPNILNDFLFFGEQFDVFLFFQQFNAPIMRPAVQQNPDALYTPPVMAPR